MLLKELKSLKDQCEVQREFLKNETRNIKNARIDIRKLNNEIKSLNQEISSMDSKGLHGNKLVNETGTLTQSEIEDYTNVFRQISEKFFEKFKSESDSKTDEHIVSVDVEFIDARISFYINHNTRFVDLRKQVASYWSLPLDEIFFADEPSTPGILQSIFLLDSFVIEEIYVWKKIKLKDENFVLYLVLKNYNSLQQRMDEMFPRKETEELDSPNPEDVATNLISSKEAVDKLTEIKNMMKIRKKVYFIQTVLQTICYFTLFFLWVFIIITEISIENSTWVNRELENTFIYEFNYTNNDNFEVYGNYDSTLIMKVSSIYSLWQYIDVLRNIFYNSANQQGIISNSLYALDYIQISQIRTQVNICKNPYVGNYSCTTDYNIFDNYKGSIGNYSFQNYQSISDGVYIAGILSLYPLAGYSVELPVKNETGWNETIFQLKNTTWIDTGTRAVFISMNFINPTSQIITSVVPFFEISSSGVFIRNFKISTAQNKLYSVSSSIIHFFIVLIVLFLLFLEIGNNIRLKDEKRFFSVTPHFNRLGKEEMQELLLKHKQIKCYKRFRKPELGEFFSFLTLIFILVLELTIITWYNAVFNKKISSSAGYSNIYGTLQGYNMINDARSIMTLWLSINIIRYILIWLSKVSQMFKVVIYSSTQYSFYIVLFYIPLLAFSVHYMYFLGPYSQEFNSLHSSLLSVIQIFNGQWPSATNFLNYIDSGYFVAVHMFFIIWRMIVIKLQIIMFQSNLSLTKSSQ